MIDRYVAEIKACLYNGCCMSALMMSLTLPDMCGKAEYPKMEKETKKRYIKWFDEYIGQYELDKDNKNKEIPYFNGVLCYALRCSLFHQGNPDISNDIKIDKFELKWEECARMSTCVSCRECEIEIDDNGEEKLKNIKYCIDIKNICYKLCECALKYYEKNKEKFNFIKYNIVDATFRTKETFYL